MILAETAILQAIERGEIVIRPFRRECLGPNSYDVHLGAELAVYLDPILDARRPNAIRLIRIPEDGLILEPDRIYLGVTEEYTESFGVVPFLEGKSSVGRLGIDIHATAGVGDIGFCNHWTLEISVKQPVRVYAGMPIGQLIFFRFEGQPVLPYCQRPSSKYVHVEARPQPSAMYLNFHSDG